MARTTLLIITMVTGIAISAEAVLPWPHPYPPLSGAPATGAPPPGAALSPDPLVHWRWPANTTLAQLQIYNVTPQAWSTAGSPNSYASFRNLDSLIGVAEGGHAEVLGPGSFVIDFGTESAGWVELDSPDMPEALYVGGQLTVSVSEVNTRYPGKDLVPIKHGCCTYRLETNAALYEGARFAIVTVHPPPRGAVPGNCTASCVAAGHCCVGNVSSYNQPSCTMGCTIARGTALVGACQRTCLDISRNGSCDVPAWRFNLCENCPPGCKSPSVDECLAGCAFADGAAPVRTPWHITAVRVVAQSMPVPYAGAFAAAADPLITQVCPSRFLQNTLVADRTRCIARSCGLCSHSC